MQDSSLNQLLPAIELSLRRVEENVNKINTIHTSIKQNNNVIYNSSTRLHELYTMQMAFDSAVCEFVDLALAKLDTITSVESPIRNRSNDPFELGSAVIFPTLECWVEGTIIDYFQEDDIYIVEDSDKYQFKAKRKQIIVKPKVRKQQPVQSLVLAHFPDTTAFYEGRIVTASSRDEIEPNCQPVQFKEDTDEYGMIINYRPIDMLMIVPFPGVCNPVEEFTGIQNF